MNFAEQRAAVLLCVTWVRSHRERYSVCLEPLMGGGGGNVWNRVSATHNTKWIMGRKGDHPTIRPSCFWYSRVRKNVFSVPCEMFLGWFFSTRFLLLPLFFSFFARLFGVGRVMLDLEWIEWLIDKRNDHPSASSLIIHELYVLYRYIVIS